MNGDATVTSNAIAQDADADFDAGILLEPIAPTVKTRAVQAWERIEQFLVYAGDWLNPILVKETRQALKSFHFTITFVLVLAACWVVTIAGVAIVGPSIFFAAAGGSLLSWYYAILAFPLIVVVPFYAFRSLASEREDNTYDLLSITALKPRQIISGKLGSAVVQMAVYFSAITPCVAFTYLLRGVDVPTIIVLIGYTFFTSLGLSMVGVLLATLSEQRFAQVFVSVALVAFLLWTFFASILGIGVGVIQFSYSFVGGEEFWIIVAALATAYLTTFALCFFAASGMITFATENRSTPLRICMLVQQAAWIGWMFVAWIVEEYDREMLLLSAGFAGAYWYAMGALLTSERRGISQRVKRRLPTSFLGRVFLSWLNPGPASGYMFVVANGTVIVLACLLGLMAKEFLRGRGGWPSGEEMFFALIVGWSYAVAYLGFGLLVIRALRRFTLVNMVAGVLIHVLVVLAGSGIPTVIQLMSVELRYVDYSLLQISNPFWSLHHLTDGGIAMHGPVLILVVPAAAICMLLLNMRSVVGELQAVRIAAPARVLEDEAELHPPPEPGPQNPWDEPG
jgi:hypothetical protein